MYQKNSFWLEASHLSFDHCINQSSVWRNIKLFQTNMYRYSSQYHWIFFNGCIKFLFFLSVMMPSKIFVECKHLADSFFFFKQLAAVCCLKPKVILFSCKQNGFHYMFLSLHVFVVIIVVHSINVLHFYLRNNCDILINHADYYTRNAWKRTHI